MQSKYLSPREIKGLLKVGDCMLPACDEFPSFSQTGCMEHIDTILARARQRDLFDLKLLLRTLSFIPTPFISALLKTLRLEGYFPLVGTLMRQMSLGLKGIVFMLYYSNKTSKNYQGKKVYDILEFQVQCKQQ